MHYYPFNIADYRKDTGHLSITEHYIYRTLIDWYYMDESPISLETQVVARRLRLGLQDHPNLDNVLSDFFEKTENGYIHKRIEEEIVQYNNKAKKNRDNGKKGGRPKRLGSEKNNNPVGSQVVSQNNPSQSESNPNQEPITNNQEPLLKKHTKKDLCPASQDGSIKSIRDEKIKLIFNSWVKTMGKDSTAKLTSQRKSKISARLKDGYSSDQICLAITGCAKSEFHMGKNDTGTVYDDIGMICREGSQIEKFSTQSLIFTPKETKEKEINDWIEE